MKKLMIIPLTIMLMTATGGLVQGGLFDALFDTTPTKNSAEYGKIVWKQNGPRHAILTASFQQPALVPPPAASSSPIAPMPEAEGHAMPSGQPIALYHRVKYEDLDNIHPCAVRMIVQVQDPCPPPRDPCSCCKPAPRYVFVEICVPPCGCPKIKTRRHGSKVEYDYGKYEIDIKSKNGVVTVNYDD